jgi:AraC-like DNA-binding protein
MLPRLQYLGQYPTHRCRSPEDVEASSILYHRVQGFHFLSGTDTALACNSIAFGDLRLGITASTGHEAWLWDDAPTLMYCLSGGARITRARSECTLTAGQVVLVTPGERITTADNGSVAAFVRLPIASVEWGREAFLPDTSGLLARSIAELMLELSRTERALASNRLATAWTGTLTDLIRSLFDKQQPKAGPRTVSRIEEMIASDLAGERSIEDMAAELGVTLRAVQLGFARYRGLSPSAFRARVRMTEARTRLLSARPSETVTSILALSGVTHPGRFASAYKARYGELPSQTIAWRCGLEAGP